MAKRGVVALMHTIATKPAESCRRALFTSLYDTVSVSRTGFQ